MAVLLLPSTASPSRQRKQLLIFYSIVPNVPNEAKCERNLCPSLE